MTRYDLIVLGGGTAGLTAAVTAAGVGAKVALVERDRTGGDCLWTGCVPSKALISAARVAHDMRTADRFGIEPVTPKVDLGRIMDGVHEVIHDIEPHDSPERLRSLGIEVVHGEGRFVGPRRLSIAGRLVDTRVAIIATGARPALPPVDGLADAPHLTSDTVWELRDLPDRLVVLGGGAIGVELSHAFARLGSQVTTVEMADTILTTEEPETQALIASRLRADGVDVREATTATRVVPDAGETTSGVLEVRGPDGATATIPYDRLLVATGRTPNTRGIGLEAAGVQLTDAGHVVVDPTMRTTATGVFAAGDVLREMPFTHAASAEGSTAMMNGLFGLRRAVDHTTTPYAIFTDPEVARVGLTEAQARAQHDDVVVRTADYGSNDRAMAARATHGFAKLVADGKGRILGATVVGEAAGESIAEIVAWMHNDGKLDDLGAATHAYPTFSEGPRTAALEHLRDKYQSPRVRTLLAPVLWLLRLLDRRS